MKNILAPSILSADFTRLGEEMRITEECGAQYIHFDVMDGIFVPNISFGIPVLKSIHKATAQVMDVHLMITEPIRYIDAFAEAGADLITIHYEACENVRETITKIREAGVKVGVSVKPATPVSVLEPLLDQIDMVLIMSVEPGFGGQKFMPEALDKVRAVRKMAEEKELELDIQVDGGIGTDNVETVLEAGANVIVAGSAVFKATEENTKKFMEILRSHE